MKIAAWAPARAGCHRARVQAIQPAAALKAVAVVKLLVVVLEVLVVLVVAANVDRVLQ